MNQSAWVLRNTAKKIFQAFVLILFFGSIFILLGKQLYKGVLTQKCVFLPPHNASDLEYSAYVSNSSHWLEERNGYFLCGNGTGSRPCPENYTCLKGADANSYVSHFNFYGSSVVTISQLMTLHFWQELYQRMLLTAGTLHVTYFVFAFYSFLYSSGLILALITRAYGRIQLKGTEKEPDSASKKSNACDAAKGMARSPSCKSYELFSSQVINVDRIGRQSSESFACADKVLKSGRCSQEQRKKRSSKCRVDGDGSNDSSTASSTPCSRTSRHFSLLRKWMRSQPFEFCAELFFAAIIFAFLVASVLRFSHRLDPDTFIIVYGVFGAISAWEVLLKFFAYGPRLYFQNHWNVLDSLVLILSGAEVILFQFKNSILLVLRAFKLVRVMVCSSTCNYLICIMDASLCLFQNPVSVLLVFMCICVVSGMQLYGIEYFHSEDRFPNQEPPRWYFKDCYSSFLLVFCMLCGDWKQPMVNTVLFTSCASDLFMLIFVLFGNLVVMNLFLGVVFYTFFYKTYSESSCNTGRKFQNAFQVILHGQNHVHCPKINSKENQGHTQGTLHTSSSDIVSDTHDYSNHPFEEGRILSHGQGVGGPGADESSSEYMADCCPALCYFCCSFCKADENPVLWQNWADVRCRLYCFVEEKAFKIAVFAAIFLSIALLIMSHSPGPTIPEVIQVIQVLNPCVFLLFTVEMFLKWMAYGLQKYFKSHLGRLEFFILFVYLLDLLPITFFEGQKNIFKALKSFRLLSVIPLLKSYQESEPLPIKQNDSLDGSTNASKESLLHLRKMECNHFLGGNCGYRPSGSGEILQMDWNMLEVVPDDACMSRMKRVELNNVTEFRSRSSPVAASHCLPDVFYRLFWCREECSFWNVWKSARTKVLIAVSSKYFSVCHGLAIVISCSMLAVEASFFLEKPALVISVSYYVDRVFAVFLFLEIVVKCFGLGFREYFTSLFCIMEFIVALASLSYVILDYLEVSHLQILKIMRVFLLLYLCKVFGLNKQAKCVVASLGHGLPAYLVAFLFIVFLWLVFAVLSVAMFEKKLLKCVDGNGDLLRTEDCALHNGTVRNSVVNFDSVENALIALLQVATLQDWMNFVTDIMDNVNDYNRTRNEIYTALFFPIFIMFSTFLTVNFFAGITCWIFNDLKRADERGADSHTEALYKSAVTKMESTKLRKTVPQPKFPFQAFLYRMVMSDNFEVAGFVFIGLHMLLIALDMYDPQPSEMFVLAMTELNVFFIVIFALECLVKLLALRHYYFLSPWNHFDVLVTVLCVCGVFFPDLFSSPMLPAMLRLVRFLKGTRYLRRYARGMLPLLHSLHRSLPACAALLAIQFVAMFVFAVFGVHLFRRVRQSWDASGELSFETFPRAMLLLFQLSTLSGYADVLGALSEGPLGTLYVVSYVVVVHYVVIRTHLIVALDSLDAAMREFENILLREDYEMFAEVWQRFDPAARGVVHFGHLADMLDAMEEPFRFCRPNRFLIASLNVPIYEGELVHYADLMDALTRDFMGQRAHLLPATEGLPGLLDDEGRTRRKVASSLWRQRQHHCAHVIQRAWRRYAGRGLLAPSPVFYSEVRLASADRVDTCLAGEVRSAGHASV